METNEGVGSFSDYFSPENLCDWLAAMFKANGLELKEEQRCVFIGKLNSQWMILLNYHPHAYTEEEINGLAFRKLTDVDLKEMGFKRGPHKNILDIVISLLSVEV